MRGAGGFPGSSGARGHVGTGAQGHRGTGARVGDTFAPNGHSLMMSIETAQISVLA